MTRGKLHDAFCSIGLKSGDQAIVHSSLRALGPLDGGAGAVVETLLDILGEDGLLVVPTFTYDSQRFDPSTTPGRAGALSEWARHVPGAVRSRHPTHSVAAIGAGAAAFCADHELRAATDLGTPLDRLAASGGYVLLLGVGQASNTMVHVGEFHAAAFYLDIPFSPIWPREHTIVDGDEVLHVAYDRFPGCSRAFGVVERGLRARGALRDGGIARAHAQLIPAAAIVEETVALLADDPRALLCSDPSCYRCVRARARIMGAPDVRARATEGDRGE
ncbi:MAG TPA: AAC(3) family N-acetyltransferase [Gaiellaceae bacterium]